MTRRSAAVLVLAGLLSVPSPAGAKPDGEMILGLPISPVEGRFDPAETTAPGDAARLASLKRGDLDITYGPRPALTEELRRTPGLTLKPTFPPSPSG